MAVYRGNWDLCRTSAEVIQDQYREAGLWVSIPGLRVDHAPIITIAIANLERDRSSQLHTKIFSP
jgi:hypothetical protein